jgi:hypothetical protein
VYSIVVTYSIDYSDPECFLAADQLAAVVKELTETFGEPHKEVENTEDPTIYYEYYWGGV